MALYCTKQVYYLPSQLQRRGNSYAESKTECQSTNHCKLYSLIARSEKLRDYARNRGARRTTLSSRIYEADSR
jgi:hypothetical protein